jgi:hypothetical protein
MKSYQAADKRLTGRTPMRRKIGNNTWLERRGDDIAVRLHDTDIVVYHPDGSITLDTGGWFTVTTKARMNEHTEFGVSSVRGEWQVAVRNPAHHPVPWPSDAEPEPYWLEPVPFHNGMTWHGDHWTGVPEPDEIEAERAARKKLTREINAFIKSITPERITHAWENPGGDCLMCRLEPGVGGTDHLATHVEEDYFHASLAYQAIKAANFNNPEFIMQMIYADAQYGRVSDTLTSSLRKYLKRNLIEGVAVR